MPFRYGDAPVLAGAHEASDFPLLLAMLTHVNRTTLPAKFSSRFRSRRQPLPKELSVEIIRIHDRQRAKARPQMIAKAYHEALPYPPNRIDPARAATYQELLKKAGGGVQTKPARVSSKSRGKSRGC